MRRIVLSDVAAPFAVCALILGVCVSVSLGGPIGSLASGQGGPRDGEIIVEQLPTQLGGLGSDTAFRDYIGRPVWQQIADNILLTQGASVRHVEWYGLYGGYMQDHFPPVGDENMRVRFYSARAGDGLPGGILYEESFLNPSRTATGLIIDGQSPEYLFGVNLSAPFSLAAAAPYWLEIVQVGNVDSTFRWESGFGIVPGYCGINNSLPDWQFDSFGSQAFRLSTVPEPTILALIVFGALFTPATRHRKEDTHGHISKPRRH